MRACDQKKICELCGKEISVLNFSKHKRGHETHPEKYIKSRYSLNHDGLICQFCNKECKNRNALCQHERLCKNNPEAQLIKHNSFRTGRTAWNKGLTKYTDERVAKNALATSKTLKGRPGRKHSDAEKQKFREAAIRNGFGGMHRNSHSIIYDDIKLNSTYELAVAQDLDKNNVRWEKPQRLFYLDPAGKERSYTADFYLPDYDLYLDPKNDYLIENINPALGFNDCDKIKWVMEQNNVKIIVLNKEQLNWNSIKELAKI